MLGKISPNYRKNGGNVSTQTPADRQVDINVITAFKLHFLTSWNDAFEGIFTSSKSLKKSCISWFCSG